MLRERAKQPRELGRAAPRRHGSRDPRAVEVDDPGARVRAVTSSVMILFITGGGMLIGPWAMGALSDALAPTYGADSLRVAMICVLGVMALGVVALLLGTRTLAADLARAQREGC